nr:MAG TPA: hypothetical protein [Caudoviricetes sp.]
MLPIYLALLVLLFTLHLFVKIPLPYRVTPCFIRLCNAFTL